MSALDKLINLLEQVKIDVPELQEKAASALDVLLSGEDELEPDPVEECFEQPEPEIELEPAPEPARDERYIPVSDEDVRRITKVQGKIASAVNDLGILLQNYEADKELLLEDIDRRQKTVSKQLVDLNSKYRLPEGKQYHLALPYNNPVVPGQAAFIIMENS